MIRFSRSSAFYELPKKYFPTSTVTRIFSYVSCKTSHSFPFYVCSSNSFLVKFRVWFEVEDSIIRCVRSLVIREMEVSHAVHAAMRYHCKPTERFKGKRLAIQVLVQVFSKRDPHALLVRL